jgi:NCAIR mutase (PurE)-related protein
MNVKRLKALLHDVERGKLSIEDALDRLRHLPFEDLGFAKIDHHRPLRAGMPEVIFAEGKPAKQVAEIFASMAKRGNNVLATRTSAEKFQAIRRAVKSAQYSETARAVTLMQDATIYGKGTIAVVCAGTSDIPVAEEAVVTARAMGNEVLPVYDIGVAGLHRLLASSETIRKARVIIVCAGMEGALPSVVAGLVGVPVIAVPTSVGYGASFGGIAALLGMLNSCAPNVAVVNIDNGFGAAYIASTINRL